MAIISLPQRGVWNLKIQRWLIPVTLSVLGIGYTYWEVVIQDRVPISSEQAVLGFLLQGLIVPLVAWLTLTWASQGAEYWQAASQALEVRVAERTLELESAKEKLAEKAQVLSQVLAEERRIEEKTRAEIAADLHDSVQQLIVGALYEIQSAREALGQNSQTFDARLALTQDLLRRINVEMRGAIHNLHPVALDAQGLVPVLRECVAQFERVTRIRCQLQVGGEPHRFTPEVEVAAFRIAQEALNNVQAHAQAQAVRVELNFQPNTLSLKVSDDGVGFNPELNPVGSRVRLGLIGMYERAANVGGNVEIESGPGRGTCVIFSLTMR